MKINKIILENFALIESAMNKKRIEIDFSNSHNKIILLQGDNGSGKTSLLSNFHPFPHIGSLDLRNNNTLIIEGKDGYKYIEYICDKDIIKIYHKYICQKDKWKVSSYMSINDKEMNPSGSVTNFYKLIMDYFGIDSSFLKIIRMGSNVNNLIKLKSSERKEFVSMLLEDINVFSKLHKNVNDQSKKMKMEIKILTDNINKINIIDKDESLNQLKRLREDKDYLSKILKEKTESVFRLEGRLEELKYTELKSSIIELNKSLDSEHAKLKNILTDRALIDIENDIQLYEEQIKEKELTLSTFSYSKENIESSICKLENKKFDLSEKIKFLNQVPEIEIINEELAKVTKLLDEKEKEFDGKSIMNLYDEKLILEDNNTLTLVNNLIDSIFEMDDNAYQLFKELYLDSFNDLDTVRLELNRKATKLESKKLIKSNQKLSPAIGCTMYNECPLYNQMIGKNGISEKEYSSQMEIINYTFTICDIMYQIDKIMIERNKKLHMLPFQLKLEHVHFLILNKGRNDLKITLSINQEALDDIYSVREYQNLINKREKYLMDKESYNANNSIGIDFVKDELKNIDFELNDYRKKKNNIEEKISLINDDLTSLKESYEKLSKELEEANERDKVVKEIVNLTNELKDIMSKSDICTELINKRDKDKYDARVLEEKVSQLTKEITNLDLNIQMYDKLVNDRDNVEEMFETVEMVKESLSTNKGMPLLFMQLYFKGIQITANNIIREVYGDRIELCDFIINDKEFTIPYTVNGIKIKDISSASQGEVSVINLAISLAIIENFVSNYNILLLDEIDGVLSVKNKEKFFAILDYQLNKIHAEQVFVISHNNLYDTYPCDMILTSNNQNIPNNINVIYEV